MEREFVCIICPNGCRIKVDYEGTNIKNIKGDECPKGKEYVKNEITNPLRVFTGSVLVENGDFSLVSVKTSVPIPKNSSLCQNLTSDKPDSLSGTIRSCILSCSGALGTFNSKLLIEILR